MPRTNPPQHLRFSTFFFCAAVLSVASGLLATVSQAQDPPATGQPTAGKAAAGKTAEGRAAASGKGLVDKIWWNQPKKIEELGLSKEQRGKMDALLEAHLAGRQERARKQREVLGAFGEALMAGDQNAARDHGDAYLEAMSAPARGQIEMMIEVAAVMTPEQRKKLTALYPRLFSRLWIRSVSPRSLMAGGRGGVRGAQGG